MRKAFRIPRRRSSLKVAKPGAVALLGLKLNKARVPGGKNFETRAAADREEEMTAGVQDCAAPDPKPAEQPVSRNDKPQAAKLRQRELSSEERAWLRHQVGVSRAGRRAR